MQKEEPAGHLGQGCQGTRGRAWSPPRAAAGQRRGSRVQAESRVPAPAQLPPPQSTERPCSFLHDRHVHWRGAFQRKRALGATASDLNVPRGDGGPRWVLKEAWGLLRQLGEHVWGHPETRVGREGSHTQSPWGTELPGPPPSASAPPPQPLGLSSTHSLHGAQGETRPWDLTLSSSSTSGPTHCPHGNQTEAREAASLSVLPCFSGRLWAQGSGVWCGKRPAVGTRLCRDLDRRSRGSEQGAEVITPSCRKPRWDPSQALPLV